MAALASSANLADAAGVSEEGSSFFFDDDEKRSRNFAKFDMGGSSVLLFLVRSSSADALRPTDGGVVLGDRALLRARRCVRRVEDACARRS